MTVKVFIHVRSTHSPRSASAFAFAIFKGGRRRVCLGGGRGITDKNYTYSEYLCLLRALEYLEGHSMLEQRIEIILQDAITHSRLHPATRPYFSFGLDEEEEILRQTIFAKTDALHVLFYLPRKNVARKGKKRAIVSALSKQTFREMMQTAS